MGASKRIARLAREALAEIGRIEGRPLAEREVSARPVLFRSSAEVVIDGKRVDVTAEGETHEAALEALVVRLRAVQREVSNG